MRAGGGALSKSASDSYQYFIQQLTFIEVVPLESQSSFDTLARFSLQVIRALPDHSA